MKKTFSNTEQTFLYIENAFIIAQKKRNVKYWNEIFVYIMNERFVVLNAGLLRCKIYYFY